MGKGEYKSLDEKVAEQAIDLIHAIMHSGNSKVLKARDMAIKAIETLYIPKLVKNIQTCYDGDYGDCPNCRHTLNDCECLNRCRHCGQKIDWKVI